MARQHAGITGQIENCQTVVFAAYVTARAHALLDFRLYLPKSWCADRGRAGSGPASRASVCRSPPSPRWCTAMIAAARKRGGAVRAVGGLRRGIRAAAPSCGKACGEGPEEGTCSRSR